MWGGYEEYCGPPSVEACMKIADPFHQGEIEIQEMLGERSTALLNGRLYEDTIIGPAHKFLSQMFFFVLSTEGTDGISITVLLGESGFIEVSLDGKHLLLDLRRIKESGTDPVLSSLQESKKVGGLAIDLATRRRLRINGHVKSLSDSRLTLEVDESYPNCPKYIQKRTIVSSENPVGNQPFIAQTGLKLLDKQIELIQRADTFFVGSSNPGGNLDASHRGGNPGFVKIQSNSILRIPDYPGNSLYNTFGNLKLNKNSGLVFWDFENALVLHLTGEAILDFSGKDPYSETAGTGRWWEFRVQRWLLRSIKNPYLLSPPEVSPFNPEIKDSK